MPTPFQPVPEADDALLAGGGERPSKTRLKQASHDLQDIGEALVEWPDDRLAQLPIDEGLLDAIRTYKRTRSHEGRRRQMQYIGKLMRRTDAEPLRDAVAASQLGRAEDALALHDAEVWRNRLVGDDTALTDWTARFPSADVQQLRSLIRAARKDAAAVPEQRSGRAYRELFRFIRQHAVASATAPAAAIEAMSDAFDSVRIGVVSISDRASAGVYEDRGVPALKDWLTRALRNAIEWETRLIPDDRAGIEATLRELVDDRGCHLVLTTGGTGPAPRDVTPEATLAVADKVMPGFGERMRAISLHFVATAILSRQTAVIRGGALIINLPGQPKSIAETLEGLPRAQPPVAGIFAAVPYCIDLIGGPYLQTDPMVCPAFRPKSALRPATTRLGT